MLNPKICTMPNNNRALRKRCGRKGENMKKCIMTFQVNPEVRAKLGEIAEEKDLTLSQLMRRIINQYLKKYEESKQK